MPTVSATATAPAASTASTASTTSTTSTTPTASTASTASTAPTAPTASTPWTRSTTAAEVAAHPLVCLPRGAGIRAAFEEGCAARGVRFEVAMEASAPSAVADLAARGLGVAVLSESMAEGRPGHAALVAVPIVDLARPAVLALRWSTGAGPGGAGVRARGAASFGC